MSMMRPTAVVRSVGELTPDAIADILPGAQGVTFDLDKALVGQHDTEIPLKHLAMLHKLGEAGLGLALVSNARQQERAQRVQDMATCIGPSCLAVALVEVGGKAKPDPAIFWATAERLSLPVENLVHVGDQILKDVLGANRASYGATVLVAPYGEGDHTGVKYLQRPVEAALRPFLGLPLLTRNFPANIVVL